jgi:hypothetical protein
MNEVGTASAEKQVSFELVRRPKVAIIGCADSRSQAPWHLAHEYEFWGVNNLHLQMPGPYTRWFELHKIEALPNGAYLRRGQPLFKKQPVIEYLKSLKALNIPVYMQQPLNAVPNAVEFPLAKILERFPRRYFTNTVSWMIALALLEGFKTIAIYGVDMAVSSTLLGANEYAHQRPSCEYFIGIAEGLGVEVVVPPESDLLKTNFMYAIEEPQEIEFLSKCREMQAGMARRKAQAEAQANASEQKIQQYIGAEAAINEVIRIRCNLKSDPQEWKHGVLASDQALR